MPNEDASREMLLREVLEKISELRTVPGDVAVIRQQVDTIVESVNQNSKTLRGQNGDGGLLGMVNSIGQRQSNDHDKLCEIDQLINGDPSDHNKSGMRGDLRDVKTEVDKYRRITWIAVSTAIGSAMSILVALIRQYLGL